MRHSLPLRRRALVGKHKGQRDPQQPRFVGSSPSFAYTTNTPNTKTSSIATVLGWSPKSGDPSVIAAPLSALTTIKDCVGNRSSLYLQPVCSERSPFGCGPQADSGSRSRPARLAKAAACEVLVCRL